MPHSVNHSESDERPHELRYVVSSSSKADTAWMIPTQSQLGASVDPTRTDMSCAKWDERGKEGIAAVISPSGTATSRVAPQLPTPPNRVASRHNYQLLHLDSHLVFF